MSSGSEEAMILRSLHLVSTGNMSDPLDSFRTCHQETLFVGFVCSYVLVSRSAFPFITAFDSCTQVIRMPRTVTIINYDESSIFSIRSLWTNESRSTERCYNTPETKHSLRTRERILFHQSEIAYRKW